MWVHSAGSRVPSEHANRECSRGMAWAVLIAKGVLLVAVLILDLSWLFSGWHISGSLWWMAVGALLIVDYWVLWAFFATVRRMRRLQQAAELDDARAEALLRRARMGL